MWVFYLGDKQGKSHYAITYKDYIEEASKIALEQYTKSYDFFKIYYCKNVYTPTSKNPIFHFKGIKYTYKYGYSFGNFMDTETYCDHFYIDSRDKKYDEFVKYLGTHPKCFEIIKQKNRWLFGKYKEFEIKMKGFPLIKTDENVDIIDSNFVIHFLDGDSDLWSF